MPAVPVVAVPYVPVPVPSGLPVLSVAGVLPDRTGNVDVTRFLEEWASGPLAGKADKASPASAGNLASLDASGNLVDSGATPESIASSAVEVVVANAPGTMDTLKEIADILGSSQQSGTVLKRISDLESGKVDKEDGKGLVAVDAALATSGAAADAKAVGDALRGGFTEWVWDNLPTGCNVTSLSYEVVDAVYQWVVVADGWDFVEEGQAGPDAEELIFTATMKSEPYESFSFVTATRHLITPTKTSQLTNDGAPDGGGTPYATTSQIPDVTGKADKAVPSAAGNLASLDASGNLVDSGATFTTSLASLRGAAVSGAHVPNQYLIDDAIASPELSSVIAVDSAGSLYFVDTVEWSVDGVAQTDIRMVPEMQSVVDGSGHFFPLAPSFRFDAEGDDRVRSEEGGWVTYVLLAEIGGSSLRLYLRVDGSGNFIPVVRAVTPSGTVTVYDGERAFGPGFSAAFEYGGSAFSLRAKGVYRYRMSFIDRVLDLAGTQGGMGLLEATARKVESLSEGSTHAQYPSARCVYEALPYALVPKTPVNGAVTLSDRAVNAVSVSDATELALPALVNAGKSRDFLVRFTVSADAAVTFSAPTGETITWDDAGSPTATYEAGTHLLRFTEVAPSVFHFTDLGSGGSIDPAVLNGKLEATSAAPAFDPTKTYSVGEHVTYEGVLYECSTAVTTAGAWTGSTNWTATDMTSPDATLDLMADGRLRLVSADGEVLWMQGYGLSSASSVTLSCDKVNFYAFASGTVTQAFDMPSAPSGKVGDFVLDVDNTANASASATATLTGAGTAFDVFTPEGVNLSTDILTFAGGEQCELYFTMTAFGTAAKPAWKVVKQVVEKQEFGS